MRLTWGLDDVKKAMRELRDGTYVERQVGWYSLSLEDRDAKIRAEVAALRRKYPGLIEPK